ncbi:MAG: hypothetical protein ABI241_00420 [Bacteroidia bacterium]
MKNELCFHLDTKKRKGTSVYFEANNCETLCKTQYYKSKAGLTKGLQSVVINRKAEIKYLT